MAELHSTCQRKVRKSIDEIGACGLPVTHGNMCQGHWETRDRLMGPCGACEFYNPVGEGFGQCRRYAPKAGNGTPVWPVTAPDLECGDFRSIR